MFIKGILIFKIIIIIILYSIIYKKNIVYSKNLSKENIKTSSSNFNQQFVNKYGNYKIKKIIIKGLKKTKEKIIKSCLNVNEGDRLLKFNENKFIKNIYRLKIIKDVSVSFIKKQKGVYLVINIKEKITFVPIPVVVKSKDAYNIGILGIESNLLGECQKLFFMGMYSNLGWKSMFGISKPGTTSREFIYQFKFGLSNSIYQNTNIENEKIQQYKSKEYKFNIDLGYRFNNYFEMKYFAEFSTSNVDENYEENLIEPGSLSYFIQGSLITLKSLSYTNITETGLNMKMKYQYGINTEQNNNDFYKINNNTKYSFNTFLDHIMTLYISVSTGNAPTFLKERIGGKNCFKSIPANKIIADHYIGSSINYELPFFYGEAINLSWIFLVESGKFKLNNYYVETYRGIGTGVRLYLKEITIPAVGFNYAYNLDTKNSEYSLALGFNF